MDEEMYICEYCGTEVDESEFVLCNACQAELCDHCIMDSGLCEVCEADLEELDDDE